MERNPDTDYGPPGSLAHYIETFDDLEIYSDIIAESVNRCPTTQTIILLNRCLNSLTGSLRERALSVLRKTVNDSDTGELAESLLKFQESKGV